MRRMCENSDSAARVGGRGGVSEELFGVCKSIRIRQSLQERLRRPVPCEQGAADLWATVSSADLRYFVCVSGVLDYEFVVLCLGIGIAILCFVSLGSKSLSRYSSLG